MEIWIKIEQASEFVQVYTAKATDGAAPQGCVSLALEVGS